MVDRIKVGEVEQGIDGASLFRRRCEELSCAYDNLESRLGIRTGRLMTSGR